MKEANKRILRYVLLPQVIPRAREFVSSGFGYVAFFMALAYRAARLLPAGHPYLSPANMNRYTIRNVIAEAASSLVWKKENTDQIVIFWLILLGLGILCMQFGLLGLALLTNAAHAAMTMPTSYDEFFVTTNTTYDIAFVLLDRVFGVPDIFNSCVAQGVPCYNNSQADGPYPFHAALHAVFQYYSIGLLVVAVLIFLYFIMAIVAETAQTGTPFGKRFNHVWAPIRMVVALGLLVPLASGLNSAQYITLYAAKWGSGFATNGWIRFVDTAVTADETLIGTRERLVAVPNEPSINQLVVFFSAVATCARAERRMHNRTVEAYLINPFQTGTPRTLEGTDFTEARDNYYSDMNAGGDRVVDGTRFLIYFGYSPEAVGGRVEYPSKTQNVPPICGSITFEMSDLDPEGSPGSEVVMQRYYEMLQGLWAAARDGGAGGGAGGSLSDVTAEIGEAMVDKYLPLDGNNPTAALPTRAELDTAMEEYQTFVHDAIAEATLLQQDSDAWVQDLIQFGWAGAAIWYNQIATINGALIGAAQNLPQVYKFPKVMEEVQAKRGVLSQFLQNKDRFRPMQPDGKPVDLDQPEEQPMAVAMYQSTMIWGEVGGSSTGLFIIDMINSIFGFQGLFNMQDNPDIHPLAQLVAIGKGIVNSAVMNLGEAFGGFIGASVAKAFDPQFISSAATALASFHGSVAMIGLGVGFVLFYVVPFLPFIYFFFAVGAWIKTIFEAMVGVPLWALAHIRIDGEGLPGDAAMGGYYLILDIFLRPILIIFGMLGGITIFAAQVRVLNEIWSLVTSNVSGFDREAAAAVGPPVGSQALTGAIEWLRTPVDEFFFTIIYAIVVYMMGLSSFKLVDMIPNNILRWMGSNAQTFGDNSGDEAANLMRNSMIGGVMTTSRLKGAMQQASQVPGQAVAGLQSFGKS